MPGRAGRWSVRHLIRPAKRQVNKPPIPTDTNVRDRRNLGSASSATVVLIISSWSRIHQVAVERQAVVDAIAEGEDKELSLPCGSSLLLQDDSDGHHNVAEHWALADARASPCQDGSIHLERFMGAPLPRPTALAAQPQGPE